MKIVYDSGAQVTTLLMGELIDGRVYTDVSDEFDTDLYLATDQGGVVSLETGIIYLPTDLPASRFVEVDVTLVVKK